ncbi:MAG: hypothetical protein R3B39_01980 [Candidatus Paceibacterota bacterium]
MEIIFHSSALFGSGDGESDGPIDIEIDSLGNLYVVDYAGNRVQKFDSDGNYISQFGSSGSGDGQFVTPWGMDIDSIWEIFM